MKALAPLPTMYMSENYPEFWPTESADFIGDARQLAETMVKIVTSSRKLKKKPEKFFISGPPGIGKTCLKYLLMHLLNVTKWGVMEFSGTDVTIDVVRELHNSLHLTMNDMFGEYRLIVINEADSLPPQAQIRALEMLDKVPPGTFVLCTANSRVQELEKRFHGRFKFSAIQGATIPQIVEFLGWWKVPGKIAENIAVTAGGSLRIACQEAEEWLQTSELVTA